jgi:photoactive yellow protein
MATLPSIEPDQPLTVRQIQAITDLDPARLDALPIGVIRVDRQGTILAYNATESRLAGLQPADVVGRNFFRDVAPCTNVREFAGRFQRGVERGSLYEAFPYTFRFEPREVSVVVTLFHQQGDEDAWIFVSVQA